MRTRTDKEIVETGRKAFNMMIELENIPYASERERILLEKGWRRAKERFNAANRPPERRDYATTTRTLRVIRTR
jgi:hypothetical protein